jgi:hypothetical protein
MNGFLAAALGYREFRSGDEVRALVSGDEVRALVTHRDDEIAATLYPSSHGSAVKRDPRDIRLMLLFSTPTQRSWLALDRFAVYQVLDDLRKEEPRVQWLARRADVHAVKANHDHSPTSGILHLGTHGRGWLYSKDLFQDRDVAEAVQQFIGGDDASSL